MIRSNRRGREAGFSFIEILVVLSIIAVLASMVVMVVPFIREKAKRAKSVDNVRQMIQFYIGSGVGLEKAWPGYNGKDFVLWLAATNKISRDDNDSLSVLFSPGDQNYTLENAGGKAAYKDLTKAMLGTGNQNLLKLTSYAGRRNREREHILSSSEQQKNGMIVCDDDDGDLHHKDGIVCGFVSGSAKFLEWSDLDMSPPADSKDPRGTLGDSSPNEQLKHMSSGN